MKYISLREEVWEFPLPLVDYSCCIDYCCDGYHAGKLSKLSPKVWRACVYSVVAVYYVGIILDEDRQTGKELSVEESLEICSEDSSLALFLESMPSTWLFRGLLSRLVVLADLIKRASFNYSIEGLRADMPSSSSSSSSSSSFAPSS